MAKRVIITGKEISVLSLCLFGGFDAWAVSV